jgi:hypothetical protein
LSRVAESDAQYRFSIVRFQLEPILEDFWVIDGVWREQNACNSTSEYQQPRCHLAIAAAAV